MQAATTLSLLLPAAGAILVVVGALLLKRGRWPRRVGETAHCPKCDYILSGGQPRCPECGTVVRPEDVVRGERPRRPGSAWAGGSVALLGLALLTLFATGLLNTIDWNRHRPLAWLLKDLGANNPSVRAPAWAEIRRRLDDNQLSESEQDAVVDRGLDAQASGAVPTGGNNILDFVAKRYLDHKLDPARAERFFAGALKVNLSVRPVVGAQSRVPYSITGTGRGPAGWWMRMRTLESRIDDGPVQTIGGGSGGGFGGWSTSSTLPPVPTPGKHRLRLRVEMATDPAGGAGGASWDDNAVVAGRVTRDLFADFQVVEGTTPVVTVAAPDASLLQPLLKLALTFNPRGSWLHVFVDAAAPPVDLAFEAFVRFGGREYLVGNVSFHKGTPGGYGTSASDFPADAPAKVDVVFRSSETVAGETPDMTQIWKGEIVVRDVVIRRPGAPPPASAPAGPTSGPASRP